MEIFFCFMAFYGIYLWLSAVRFGEGDGMSICLAEAHDSIACCALRFPNDGSLGCGISIENYWKEGIYHRCTIKTPEVK